MPDAIALEQQVHGPTVRKPAATPLHAFLSRLIWLCMGPVVLLAAYLAVANVREVQTTRGLEAASLIRALGTHVDQDLSARIGALQMLAASPLLDDASHRADLYQEAQSFHRSFGSHVVLADLQRRMLFNTRVPYGTTLPMLPRPKGRAAAQIAIETAGPAVGDVFLGPIAHEPLVAIAVPALRNASVSYLLLTVFEARQFQKHLDNVVLPTGWALTLLDSSGAMIARRAPANMNAAVDVDAKGRFSVQSSLSPWSVLLEIPRDIQRAPLLEAAGALALAILGATLTGLLGGMLASRRLGASVAALAHPPTPGAALPDIAEIAAARHRLDETAQRREAAEATLLVSEQRFRRLFDEAPLPQALIARDGAIVDINAQFVKSFGYTLDDVPTLTDWWRRAYPDPADRAYALETWNAATARVGAGASSIEPVERVIACKNGEIRSVVVNVIGIGNDFLSTFFDVTERKLAQLRLQTQVGQLKLLDQITAAIGERQDLQSIYQVAIRSIEERLPVDFGCICRYDPTDSALTIVRVGANSEALARQLANDEQSRIEIDANGLSRCIRGELAYEPDLPSARFPFLQWLADAGLGALVVAPLQSESRVFGVLMAARRAPQSFSSGDCEFLRQLSAHVALAARQAEMHAALQQAYDDLRQTQQTVMQQERLRALGEMASGIAHDINNALSPVALYTENLLEREQHLSERGRSHLVTIARAIDDVAATVARMREFYREREPQLALRPLKLNQLLQQVVDLTRARWSDMLQRSGAVIRLETDMAPDLPTTLGIESEVREALTNLIFNAVDAMPEGGMLTLRTHCAALPDGQAHAAARRAVIEVADTGVGMDEDTQRRCLEPFFTTKGERGTGLGLPMVYGVMQRHGAQITIESAVGRGTTVRLSFPVPVAEPDVPLAAPAPQALARRLRILVVDDDPLILETLRDTLELDSHAVVAANGGQAGIDTFVAAHGSSEAFDVVITDLGMPYVDGRKVAAAVKAQAAATPVILLTGWGQRLVADGEIPAHVDQVLSKPPKLREVRAALVRLTTASDGTAAAESTREPP